MYLHSLAYLAFTGCAGLVNLASLLLFTRVLSLDAFGSIAIAVAAIGIVNSLVFWWLRVAVVRFFPEKTRTEQDLAKTVLVCGVVVAGVCTGLWVLSTLVLSRFVPATLSALCLALMWAQAGFELVLEFVRARGMPLRYATLILARATTILALGAGLAWYEPGVRSVLLAMVIANVWPLIWELRRSASLYHRGRFNHHLAREMFAFGWPLSIKFFSDTGLIASGRLVLAMILGSGAAGAYAAPLDLSQQFIGFVVSGIYLAAYPLIAQSMTRDGLERATSEFAKMLSLMLAFAVPILAVFTCAPLTIANTGFGEEFREQATALLPFLSLVIFLASLKAHYFDLSFQLSRDTRRQVVPGVLILIGTVSLQAWVAPIWGASGVASATLVGFLLACACSYWQGGKRFSLMRLRGDDVKILSGGLLMGAVILAMDRFHPELSGWTGIVLAFALYAGALVAMNAIQVRARTVALLSRSWIR